MIGEDLEQILVGGKVDDGAVAIVLHHLSRVAIGGDQHPRDIVGLDGLNEVAVAHGARRIGRIGAIQEGRANGDHHDRQEDVEPRIAPALFHRPRSKVISEGMLTGLRRAEAGSQAFYQATKAAKPQPRPGQKGASSQRRGLSRLEAICCQAGDSSLG